MLESTLSDFVSHPWFFRSIIVLATIFVAWHTLYYVPRNERMATWFHGHFVGYRGPGIVIGGLNFRLMRLQVGAVGILMSRETVDFGGHLLPVKSADHLNVGDPVKVDGFDDNWPRLIRSAVAP